jgi:flagellar motor switch protein FliG
MAAAAANNAATQSFGAPAPASAASAAQAPAAAVANTAATKGAQEQIRKVAQERPHHAASVVRGFLTTSASRQAIVQFLQELPLDAAKAVVSHMSPREAALLVNGIGDRDGGAPASDIADAMSRMQAALLAQELSPAGAQWDFLGMLTEEDLKELVQEEDTEGKALVLFHLPASRASQVYGVLAEEEKGAIIASLFDLESRNAEETEPARDRMKTRAAQLIQKPVTAIADAAGWITNIGPRLSEGDRGTMIAGTDPARRAQVQASLFCFGDAGVLPNEILLMVLQGFRPAELAQLCAGLDDGAPLLTRILETLPKQVQEIVVDEAAAQKQAATRPGAGRRFRLEVTRLKTRFEQAVKALDAAGDISLVQLFMEAGGSVTDINAFSTEAEGADDDGVREAA